MMAESTIPKLIHRFFRHADEIILDCDTAFLFDSTWKFCPTEATAPTSYSGLLKQPAELFGLCGIAFALENARLPDNHGRSLVTQIFVACPHSGKPVSTGLKAEWVVLDSLPVTIPVHCSSCGGTHYWRPQEAWVGPPLRPPADERSGARRP